MGLDTIAEIIELLPDLFDAFSGLYRNLCENLRNYQDVRYVINIYFRH
jgi:hypothetical protein